MRNLAYVNGVFCDIEDAKISINDRGFLFGDAVYEVCQAFGKYPFLFQDHMERLERGCRDLSIPTGTWFKELPSVVGMGLERTAFSETTIYIQVTRGEHPRNSIYPPDLKPNIVATFREYESDAAQKRKMGVPVSTCRDIRWDFCSIKTTNLLGNILMKNKAHQAGKFEAILLLEDKTVTEASTASVFIVKNGELHTSPVSMNILPGVNRKHVVDRIAPELGIKVQERSFHLHELLAADEVFLTSTTFLVMPIVDVDDQIIGDGKPGPVAMQIFHQFQKNIQAANGDS